MFFWPRNTPGEISTSKSRSESCLVLGEVADPVLHRADVLDRLRRHRATISLDLLRRRAGSDSGDQWSNFSEYSRTAASPRVRTAAITSWTTSDGVESLRPAVPAPVLMSAMLMGLLVRPRWTRAGVLDGPQSGDGLGLDAHFLHRLEPPEHRACRVATAGRSAGAA